MARAAWATASSRAAARSAARGTARRPRGRRPTRPCAAFSDDAALPSDDDPYELLGVARDATPREIKAAFRQLVKMFHPDVFPGEYVDEEGGITVEQHFIKLQAAYELLADEERRAEYDRTFRKHPMQASEAWRAWMEKKKRAYEQKTDLAGAQWSQLQRLKDNEEAKAWQQLGDHDYSRKKAMQRQRKQMEFTNKTLDRHGLILRRRDAAAGARTASGSGRMLSAEAMLAFLDSAESDKVTGELPEPGSPAALLGDGSGLEDSVEELLEDELEDLDDELEDLLSGDGDAEEDALAILKAQGFVLESDEK